MKNIFKEKSENRSDQIVFLDSSGNRLSLFWFVHDVMVCSNGNKNFIFKKDDNKSIYTVFARLGKILNETNKSINGDFVKNNTFTWHSMERSWDKPFEQEAGFVATLTEEYVKISFFPSQNKSLCNDCNTYYISMGGPDGWVDPYQSISNQFALFLNDALTHIQYNNEYNNIK